MVTLLKHPPEATLAFVETSFSPRERLLLVVKDDARIRGLCDAAPYFFPKTPVMPLFSSVGILEKTLLSAEQGPMRQRVLTHMAHQNPGIVVASWKSLLQKTAPINFWRETLFTLKLQETHPFEGIIDRLLRLGYVRTDVVCAWGEFAIRGDIVDVFTPTYDEPLRIDFFGDSIEGICTFDILDQKRQPHTQKPDATILPLYEYDLGESTAKSVFTNIQQRGAVGKEWMQRIEAIGQCQVWPGIDAFLPLLHEAPCSSPLELFDPEHVVWEGTFQKAVDTAYQRILEIFQGHPEEKLFLERFALPDDLKKQLPVHCSELVFYPGAGGNQSPFQPLSSFPKEFGAKCDAIQRAREDGKRVHFVLSTREEAAQLQDILKTYHLPMAMGVESFAQAKQSEAGVVTWGLSNAFESFQCATDIWIGAQDFFDKKPRKPKARQSRDAKVLFRELSTWKEGDAVVHVDHGIGRYCGLETMDVNGVHHDCVKLLYRDEARLYLPVENIDLLSRYSSQEDAVELDKLGTSHWQARKARVKKRILEVAQKLLAVTTARHINPGEVFQPQEGLFEAFCAQFPYNETDDQLQAVEDILADLAAGTPMDRLLCGDVGFGKTEVALRAAFIVAQAGGAGGCSYPHNLALSTAR